MTTVIENSTSTGAAAINMLETFADPTDNSTFNGIIRDGTVGRVGLRLNGGGSFITSPSLGALTFTGPLTIRFGMMVLNGTQHIIGGASTIVVGDTTNLPALLVVNGASLSASTGTASVQIGAGTAQGALILNSGSLSSANELWVSTANLGSGALIVNGGTVTTSSWLAIARGGGDGIFNVSGGKLVADTSSRPIRFPVGFLGSGAAPRIVPWRHFPAA